MAYKGAGAKPIRLGPTRPVKGQYRKQIGSYTRLSLPIVYTGTQPVGTGDTHITDLTHIKELMRGRFG